MKLTPWFKCSIYNPVRIGIYEWKEELTDHDFLIQKDYWIGRRWCDKESLRPYHKNYQKIGYWRGVKK